MSREPNTPIILWICAAVCAHFMFAEGGEQVARVHEDHSALKKLASSVRFRVKSTEQSFEVALNDAPGAKQDDDEDAVQPPPPPPPKPTASASTPPPPKPPEPKKEKVETKVKVVVEEKDPVKQLQQPPPQIDHRIAVRQHVKDKDQEDNPTARFVGDEANHVENETVATQTSLDQDDPNPTPGGSHAGPQDKVGDSERTKIAESEEHKGEQNRAPGEKGTEFDVQHEPMPTKPMAPVAVQAPASQEQPRAGGDGRAPSHEAHTATPQLAPGQASPDSTEVKDSAQGNWSFNPIKPNAANGVAQDQGQGQATKTPASAQNGQTQWLGLGGHPGPGQVNLNLNQHGVVAVVGLDQLRKEREADGERRRSEHRGSWQASNFERWRSAIENYVSTVKPGNQTALNTAAVPFASYLNGIHNRIHPIFADNFLGSLDALPRSHPLNDAHLVTRLEIVVSKEGRLVKMGIVKTSGVTAFDIAALDSVQRASPFGPAPGAIISTDGNVYLHWEFHRDETYACSTMNARPFMLNLPPPKNDTEPPPGPGPKSPSQERGPPPVNLQDTRQGAAEPAPEHAPEHVPEHVAEHPMPTAG
jgi:TonB family protein